MSYVDRTLSLVEKKKLQWAREREELANLNAYWEKTNPPSDPAASQARNASKFPAPKPDLLRRDSTSSSGRPSLPPLCKTQNFTYSSIDKSDREMGGETSGYGSDNPNHSPEHFQQTTWNSTGYESSSSGREDRPKWGDRGVHVGKFWEPKDVEDLEKTHDTPGWVKRGLERKTELVVSNMSPAESPEQRHLAEDDRPCTSGSLARSYIRGQNAPVEPVELAERERKRQIALAHQEAIRKQLEEREQKRKEEREQKIREEREEEMRIEREQEAERKRKEREHHLQQEKMERERKRKEALQEAIEFAEKQAKEEKLKLKMVKQNNSINNNISENVAEKEKVDSPRDLLIINNMAGEGVECKDRNTSMVLNNLQSLDRKNILDRNLQSLDRNLQNSDRNLQNSDRNLQNSDRNLQNLDKGVNMDETAHSSKNANGIGQNTKSNNEESREEKMNNRLPQMPSMFSSFSTPGNDSLALVLQTPMETLQNMQFAVLMPTSGNGPATALPIAVPITIATDRSHTSRTENRILTPSQYRNKRVCDSSTQTDSLDFSKIDINDLRVREKLNNLEISRRRLRTDERMRDTVEERPKWNANRPPTRYLKQSEKDPLYQRRKRQKQRLSKGYDDKVGYSAHSSDESQTASPRTYRKRGYIDKRGRALWRKNDQLFAQNVRVFQTEIMPLESDKDQIYYKTKSGHDCCCSCRCSDKHKYSDHVKVVDILKIEHGSPRDRYKSEVRLPECRNSHTSLNSSSEMLENLNSLHSAMAKDRWETTRTPSLEMAKLDDFLGKKKETAPILDLSRARPVNKEEFRRLFDRVPDFKMKQEKVRAEDIKIRDKSFRFKTGKKDYKTMREPFSFMDPIPTDMKGLSVKDLAAVPIDWRMLTTVRPKSKVDEEFYTRIVELRKLEMKTEAKDKRDFITDPQVRKFKNKAGVVEQRVMACTDCFEDFCNGAACTQLVYDCFSRLQEVPSKIATKILSPEGKDEKKKKKRVKKKARSKSKTKRRSRSKSPKKEPSKK